VRLPRFRRAAPEPSARVVRDDWLEWLRLSAFSPLTIKGYRLTTDRLLERWPELTFAEFTDEHILGIIEESKPASRQARRSAFQNWFQWGVRTKRIERDPMRHVRRTSRLAGADRGVHEGRVQDPLLASRA
jgi:site-specific recombinase XerD